MRLLMRTVADVAVCDAVIFIFFGPRWSTKA
jgi:hypothetical protein